MHRHTAAYLSLLAVVLLGADMIEAAKRRHHRLRNLGGAHILPPSERARYAAPPLDTSLLMNDVRGGSRKLPKEFNAVENFKDCKDVIGTIADQSNCGSCWAVSSAAAFSDRVCIATKGKVQESMSALHLLGCCPGCQQTEEEKAKNILDTCGGGFPTLAFEYIRENGIVTGGGSIWDKPRGCKPYPLKACTRLLGFSRCPPEPQENFQCDQKCFNGSSTSEKFYAGKYGKAYRAYGPNDVEGAMLDLMLNGPLVTSFDVWNDFDKHDYTQVYIRKPLDKDAPKKGFFDWLWGTGDDDAAEEEVPTGHAVRVVGWGEQNGVPYWLIANSWSDKWGDKGYFKIRRGTNECQVEEEMLGVLVDGKKVQRS